MTARAGIACFLTACAASTAGRSPAAPSVPSDAPVALGNPSPGAPPILQGPASAAAVLVPPRVDAIFEQGDRWRGNYDCVQGQTELELAITRVRNNEVDAVFSFHHAASGADGAFEMEGIVDPATRRVVLGPGAWIRRPTSYVTVGLSGVVDVARTTFRGRVTFDGCGEFFVFRNPAGG